MNTSFRLAAVLSLSTLCNVNAQNTTVVSVADKIHAKLSDLASAFSDNSKKMYNDEISQYSIIGNWTELFELDQRQDNSTWTFYKDNLTIDPNSNLFIPTDGTTAKYRNYNPFDPTSKDYEGAILLMSFQWRDKDSVLFARTNLSEEDRDDETLGYKAFLCKLVRDPLDLGNGKHKTLVCHNKEDYNCRRFTPREYKLILKVFQQSDQA